MNGRRPGLLQIAETPCQSSQDPGVGVGGSVGSPAAGGGGGVAWVVAWGASEDHNSQAPARRLAPAT